MPSTTDARSPEQRYAQKFDVDMPGVEPTDDALRDALKTCALRPPERLLPGIRVAVLALRGDARA